MNINKAKKQDFLALPKNFKISLLINNLFKLSVYILLYFRDKGKYMQVILYE